MEGHDMELKDILTLILSGVVATVGFATLIKAVSEYQRNSVTKRLELFFEMRSRLLDDEGFKEIIGLLEPNYENEDARRENLRQLPVAQKYRFLSFFEELAIMRNSKLINDEVMSYMFGYYAIRCESDKDFWFELDPKHPGWALFSNFVEDMDRAQSEFEFDRTKLHV
jgi:hypothetical protein